MPEGMEKEKKLKVGGAIKSVEGRVVQGFASVFGNVDCYGDIVHAGAFKKTIKEQADRIKHLWQHDSWEPPTAVIRGLRETGPEELPEKVLERYPEATGGLLVTREYLDTPRGNEILAGIVAGAITEMSFMFNRVKWEYEEIEEGERSHTICHLRELRLWETSDVNWGANAATVAAKSAGDEKVKSLLWMQQVLKSNVNQLTLAEVQKAGLMSLLEQFGEALTAAPRSEDEKSAEVLARTASLKRELDLFLLELT